MTSTLQTLCISKHLTLACAESMTGGALSASMVEHAQASAYFLGGVVTYSTQSKMDVLNIPHAVIQADGVYSFACVQLMAQEVQRLFKSDIAIAVSGEAQPKEGQTKLEVYSCILIQDKIEFFKDFMSGSRIDIIQGTVELLHQRCIALIERGNYGQE